MALPEQCLGFLKSWRGVHSGLCLALLSLPEVKESFSLFHPKDVFQHQGLNEACANAAVNVVVVGLYRFWLLSLRHSAALCRAFCNCRCLKCLHLFPVPLYFCPLTEEGLESLWRLNQPLLVMGTGRETGLSTPSPGLSQGRIHLVPENSSEDGAFPFLLLSVNRYKLSHHALWV